MKFLNEETTYNVETNQDSTPSHRETVTQSYNKNTRSYLPNSHAVEVATFFVMRAPADGGLLITRLC
jgi:hypothetical protein